MDEPRAYATAGAFRRALEERLKRISQAEQMDINRLRRQVSFDRLLARLFQVEPAPWALKGGYAQPNSISTFSFSRATSQGSGERSQLSGISCCHPFRTDCLKMPYSNRSP